MKVVVHVARRPEIADPQGATVLRALHDLGFEEVASVRFNREITLEVTGGDPAEVERRVQEMCDKLLANPVLEDYRVEVRP